MPGLFLNFRGPLKQNKGHTYTFLQHRHGLFLIAVNCNISFYAIDKCGDNNDQTFEN